MILDSTNKKILIIPDVHTQYERVERILCAETPDFTVCLGDWFDSFINDGDEQHQKTAVFLKQLLYKDNFVTVKGNHDLHYVNPPCPPTRCSGFEQRKWDIINSVFTKDDWIKFKWHVIVDNWILTHAGIHTNEFHSSLETLEEVDLWLEKESVAANTALKNYQLHWFYQAGYGRGGNHAYGGLVWCDWNRDFIQHYKWKQIVGHSYGKFPRFRTDESGEITNICLDSALNHYIIISNKRWEIKNYVDL